jgi:hypothetical protein
MATSFEIIEQTAPELAAAGLTPGGLDRLMQALKKANDPDLMPRGGRGGAARAAQLQVRHFANYLIAIMATDAVVHAASVVPVYRALIPIQKTIIKTERVGGEVVTRSTTYRRKLPGPTTLLSGSGDPPVWDDPSDIDLGLLLENTLRHYDSLIESQIKECVAWRARPWVELTVRNASDLTETWAFGPAPDLLAPLLARANWTRPVGVSFSMPVAVFKILAELARDDAPVVGHKNSSDAADGTAAEDTKTATPAAVGTGPASADALASQPSGNSVNLAGRSNQQDSGKKKRRQRSASSSSPGSPSSDPSDKPKDEPPWPQSNLRTQLAG